MTSKKSKAGDNTKKRILVNYAFFLRKSDYNDRALFFRFLKKKRFF